MKPATRQALYRRAQGRTRFAPRALARPRDHVGLVDLFTRAMLKLRDLPDPRKAQILAAETRALDAHASRLAEDIRREFPPGSPKAFEFNAYFNFYGTHAPPRIGKLGFKTWRDRHSSVSALLQRRADVDTALVDLGNWQEGYRRWRARFVKAAGEGATTTRPRPASDLLRQMQQQDEAIAKALGPVFDPTVDPASLIPTPKVPKWVPWAVAGALALVGVGVAAYFIRAVR